jgi:hypothetical protein
MNDMKERNPVIRLKTSVEGMGIDSYIKQLQIVDVTQSHVGDMGVFTGYAEQTTGLTGNLLGQYSAGRRSAREASNVNNNAAARVQLPIKGMWQMALLPLGRKLLANHRQGLDIQQLINIIGIQRVVQAPQEAQAFIPVDKSSLVGSYDFLVFDATLPSQRMAMAAALAQAGDILMKNPMAIFALGKDPKLLFDEWLELMGIKNADRFNLTPQRAGEFMLMAGAAKNSGTAQVSQGQGGPNAGNGPR